MSRLVVSIGHVEFTGSSQVLYVIKVHQDTDKWEVRRTYSDFRKLREDVQRVMKDTRTYNLDDGCSHEFSRRLNDVGFPSKRLFSSKKDHVIKERAVELHRFLIKLLHLTHTYRKAQKARYDQYVQSLPPDQQEAYAAFQDRTQASVTVFHLLRDFLKPVTIKTDVPPHSGDLIGSADTGAAADESDKSSSRLIRESKILAMKTFNLNERTKTMSEKEMEQQIWKELQTGHVPMQEPRAQSITKMEDKNEAPNPAHDATSSTLQDDRKSRRKTTKRNDFTVTSERLLDKNCVQKQQHCMTLDGHLQEGDPLSMLAATLTQEPKKRGGHSSLSSSASSPFSPAVSALKTKQMVQKGSPLKDNSELLEQYHSKSLTSSKKKKRSSRSKRKAKSATNIQMSDSERMSRVSSALNAQAISINAQRELEKYLSEYSAIMILRYVDRFVNKAVMKAPGCYRVNAQDRLVIDSQRFLEELEATFTDLPPNFGEIFHIGAPGTEEEWGFPVALDKYVQLKWDSFQATTGSNSLTYDYGHSSSAADQTSDSEDSDTEYEYEEVGGGGFMTAKQTFTNDEESMLQEMIANGTAGREQMLRLRRQTNEQGWNRRGNPGFRSQRVIEEASSSDTDEGDTRAKQREKRRSKREPRRSVSSDVEKYQQEQNARRKDRLSRVQSGGFV